LTNTATVTGSDGQSDTASSTTAWTCYASFVDINKTTNDLPPDPTKPIEFTLYSYATQPPETNPKERTPTLEETLSTASGGYLPFQTALVPGDLYTICENPVPAGYTFEIEIAVNGGLVLTYAGPPGEQLPTGEIQCFDFEAPDPVTESPVITFNVENSFPGGAPRTPGYWKNWNTCSGGMQAETAAKLGGVDEGVYLLNDLLPQTLGDSLTIETCEDGVLILDARDLTETDKKGNPINRSNDAAYTLARALLAARLNQDAGACPVSPEQWQKYEDEFGDTGFANFEDILTAADDLLSDPLVAFTGTGSFLAPGDLKGKNNVLVPLAEDALFLYEIIDDYNNSEICSGEESH
jgi:hypothetical protein